MKSDSITLPLAFSDESDAGPPAEILELIERGALFVVNHSGGKDSQAMYLMLRDLVPAEQLVIVHADLGAVEWAGAMRAGEQKPVATVTSWTNGSYHRNYKLEWHKDVPEGTKLYTRATQGDTQ